ncbi:MAG: RNA-directed DNA polymerase [Neisseriaceae bacterium]|nr:RNA-directed DNA polymerase [Neisseriaceae bacterium]
MNKFNFDKPYYTQRPISSIKALANALGADQQALIQLANNKTNYHYYTKHVKSGSKTKQRSIFDAKHSLKKIQKRIISRIFCHIEFPQYLHGGIKDLNQPRDYFSNATVHCNSKNIISLDIKNFYDSVRDDKVLIIFLNFFKFPKDVAQILTQLVTVQWSDYDKDISQSARHLPQGAPTSSYLANLIFFDNEYKLFNHFKRQKISYTRLLDDITISSLSEFTKAQKTKIITRVAGMVRESDLKLNNKKTICTSFREPGKKMIVTGLWVNHSIPKLQKHSLKKILEGVKSCEYIHSRCPFSFEYHKEWNTYSGKVANMARSYPNLAKRLRVRLSTILPIFSPKQTLVLERQIDTLLNSKTTQTNKLTNIKRFNKAYYAIGIISRTDKRLARKLRSRLLTRMPNITYKDYWEN